jgi:hypothetical protein
MTDTGESGPVPIGGGAWTGRPPDEAAEAEFDNFVVTSVQEIPS